MSTIRILFVETPLCITLGTLLKSSVNQWTSESADVKCNVPPHYTSSKFNFNFLLKLDNEPLTEEFCLDVSSQKYQF